MSTEDSSIPYGYCQCGCGGKPLLAPRTRRRDGYVKGEPKRYLRGHNRRQSLAEYKVQDRGYETPCWVWQRYVAPSGYGRIWADGQEQYAHRVYYERAKGSIPDGLVPDHKCGVTQCVNPDHLEAVTQAINVQRSSIAKLDWTSVRRIREMYATGQYSQRQLATRFGVKRPCISMVVNGKTWKVA